MSNPRQSISFPEVAIIHKGTPKQRLKKGEKIVEIQGKDLKDKFRIHFLPGTEDARSAFHEKNAKNYVKYGDKFTIPDGYEVSSMRVVVPAPSVWDAWDYGNEVYNAGRRIALADDSHYISLRDPLTGEYIVKDGKPFRPFTPGDTITYKRKVGDEEKTYVLKMKSHGRLRLVLEDLVNAGQLVQVTLKTQSYYDCQNISKQLAGIQNLADMINGGNAGGIPLLVYRAEADVTWNKPEGDAQRVKQWFVNIKADPNWVRFAFAQLNKHALSESVVENMMLPAHSVVGNVNPESETFEDGDEEPIEAEGVEVPEEQSPQVGDEEGKKILALSMEMVGYIAKKAGKKPEEIAKYIGEAQKRGILGKEINYAEADEFMTHINA